MSGQWGWSGNNQPVGAGLAPRPDAAQMGELERIARLYGYLPPIDQQFLAGLQGAPTPTAPLPVVMPEGRVPPSVRPMAPPDYDIMVPNGSSPRTEPRGAVPPQERATGPQTEAERNFLARLLGPRANPAASGIVGRAELRSNRQARDALLEEEAMLRAAAITQPRPAPTAPAGEAQPLSEAGPPQGPNAPGTSSGGAALSLPRFEGRDPDFERVRQQYESGRPQQRQRDPEERMLRIIAAGLAGMQGRTGVDVAAGVVGGVGQGYSRESDRDEALWQRDEDARRQFELGLAGLLGQQEQAQFNNALSRQTFDRQSAVSGEELALRREGLDVQRESAGLTGMLTRLRIASLAQQQGMAADPAQILARGVQDLVARPATQLTVDGRPLTFNVGGQELTFGQVRDRLMQQRGQASSFAANPLFATNPGMAERAIQATLGDMFMERFATLSSAQQRQLLMQIGRLGEGRARAGTTRIDDE